MEHVLIALGVLVFVFNNNQVIVIYYNHIYDILVGKQLKGNLIELIKPPTVIN